MVKSFYGPTISIDVAIETNVNIEKSVLLSDSVVFPCIDSLCQQVVDM